MNWGAIAAADKDGDGFITATNLTDPNFDADDDPKATKAAPAAAPAP